MQPILYPTYYCLVYFDNTMRFNFFSTPPGQEMLTKETPKVTRSLELWLMMQSCTLADVLKEAEKRFFLFSFCSVPLGSLLEFVLPLSEHMTKKFENECDLNVLSFPPGHMLSVMWWWHHVLCGARDEDICTELLIAFV